MTTQIPTAPANLDAQTERLEQFAAERLAMQSQGRDGEPASPERNLGAVLRIPVSLKIVLGSVTMPIANLIRLGRGAVIPLDRRVGEPVDIVVNGRTVAKGEIVVIDEASARFGISLTEIVDDPAKASAA